MPKDLTQLLAPKSIAIVGASRSPEKVGAIVLNNIINAKYSGKIYPINPNTDNINGIPCFKDIASLPEVVDLAIVALPVNLVNETLKQIGEKGIKNAVVFSAGFKETGEEGQKLEKELTEIATKYSINVLGPNCLGFVNNHQDLNATFGQTFNLPGNLRFISQSGAIAAALFDWCRSTELGFSEFITLGNKAVLNENDFLSYFAADQTPLAEQIGLSAVKPIGLYLESITDGKEFLRITKEISKTNPLFIIKPGKTKAAAKAMQSHTGAIAGEDSILDTAFAEAGITRCQTLEDFFDISRSFAWENVPNGPRVAVISNAGGPAVISADAITETGLELAEFNEDTKNKLKEVLPRSAATLNPVDVLGDALAQRYMDAAETILETDQADALLIILTPQIMTQVDKTARVISDLSIKYNKPIFCSFIGGQLVYEGEKILNENKIPSFRFPERAIAAIGAMWKWRKYKDQLTAANDDTVTTIPNEVRIKEIITNAVNNNEPALDNLAANEVITTLGLPTPPTATAGTLDEAKAFAKDNWPVVLKLSSSQLLHKANVGGVVTDIWNDAQMELAWDKLNHKIPELPEAVRNHITFQVQKDVTGGIEVIVGVKHDPTFGPVLLFGAGGHLAELVADRNLKLLPVSIDQAKNLVANSKIAKLLKTAEGEPTYALDKLYDLMVKLTHLVPVIPEATDIEINPVIITHNDVWAIDTKIVLKEKPATAPTTRPKFHTASLIKREKLANTVHYYEFESEDPLTFKSGQYISCKVSPERINSYSIAGGDNQHKFSLLVDTSPGGPGSKFFENIKEGDKLPYLGPFGSFTFKPDDGAKQILFLGTGTGCSPLKTILEAALNDPNITVPIHFFFGLRYTNDVFWQEYFNKLAGEHPNFHFNLVLSKPDENWHGQSGHITDILKQEIPDAKECSAYLCGVPAMINEATEILAQSNCPKERIYFEKF